MMRRIAWMAGSTLALIAGAVLAGDTKTPLAPAASENDTSALGRLIDERIDAGLAAANVPAGRAADDAEFLRRATLDLHGTIPSAGRVAAFLDSRDPQKRSKLIDELLADTQFGRHFGETWSNLLFVRESTNRQLRSEPLADWFARRFNDNTPWDKTVRDLITATGTQDENGAATFFISLRTPEKMNDQVCRVLLGVQLQCAQCHDHPFTGWKRSDYWSMAAFFTKVRAGGKKVGKGAPESVTEGSRGKKAPLPDSALNLPPKFLGGDAPKLKGDEPYRPALARWIIAPENPYFARATVNRVWSQFFGRGFITPVDNITDASSAAQPELYAALVSQFAAQGFDLKALVRGICNSRAYQRASDSATAGHEDDALYAQMMVRPMTPEQLYDSLAAVVGSTDDSPEAPRRKRAAAKKKVGPASSRTKFVDFFQAPAGADPAEYPSGIPQVLRLMNSPELNRRPTLLGELDQPGRTTEQRIERLYLATLSRRPTAAEYARLAAYVREPGRTPREAYEDLLWVLLNSSEFSLNH